MAATTGSTVNLALEENKLIGYADIKVLAVVMDVLESEHAGHAVRVRAKEMAVQEAVSGLDTYATTVEGLA